MAKRRKPGSGSLHLRKDGRWEGRCVVGYDEKGHPKDENVPGQNQRGVPEKLKALKESLKGTEPEGARIRHDLRGVAGPLVSEGVQASHPAQRPRQIMRTASISTSFRNWGTSPCSQLIPK